MTVFLGGQKDEDGGLQTCGVSGMCRGETEELGNDPTHRQRIC